MEKQNPFSQKVVEKNEQSIRGNFDLEVLDIKISVEKHIVDFDEQFIKETGGVEGYTRFKISWEELSKIIPGVDSRLSYNQKMYQNYDFQKKLNSIMEKLHFSKMIDGHSFAHIFDGVDRFTANSNELFIKGGMLKQKIFDFKTTLLERKPTGGATYLYSFYDAKTKKPIDLANVIPGYERFRIRRGLLPSSVLAGKTIEKLISENVVSKEQMSKIFDILSASSDVKPIGSSERSIEGLSVLDFPEEDAGLSRDYTYEKSTFSFNLKNKGFVKYLKDVKKIFEDRLEVVKMQPDEITAIKVLNEDISQINAFLEEENWKDVSSFREISGHNVHPSIPVLQSPNTVQFRWCHADRAFLITENGINFIQMKSKEIS
ncbi:MAG: hypothetical protein V4665_00845 [Patescibacteria group bacterium]